MSSLYFQIVVVSVRVPHLSPGAQHGTARCFPLDASVRGPAALLISSPACRLRENEQKLL